MLKNEFCAPIGDEWSLYSGLPYRRLVDGTVQHHTVSSCDEISGAVANHLMFELPEKFQEDFGRGTEIASRTDQIRILDYWAQGNQTMLVGVSLYLDNHTAEYWMPMTRDTYLIRICHQPSPTARPMDKEDPRNVTSHRQLYGQLPNKIRIQNALARQCHKSVAHSRRSHCKRLR
jgi:hypothetical protein